MRKMRLDPQRVVLQPDGDYGLSWALAPAPEPGKIAVALKVDTADLGQFVVPLQPAHFTLLLAVGRTLLALPQHKVEQLRRELDEQEADSNE